MRAFNYREKEIIKMLAKVNLASTDFFSFFLQKNYFTIESKKALFVLTKQKTVLLYLEKDLFNDLTKRKEELGKLFELLSLIIYLKENRYITIYPNPEVLKSDLHVMRDDFNSICTSKEDSTKVLLNNKGLYLRTCNPENIYDSENSIVFIAVSLGEDVYNLIIENFMGLLYVSEELVGLTIRDFKSPEDIRFKKQQVATWISILIAFLLGIWGVYQQLNDSKTKNFEMNKIFENQNIRLNKIDNSIEELTLDLKKNLTEASKDSLNIK